MERVLVLLMQLKTVTPVRAVFVTMEQSPLAHLFNLLDIGANLIPRPK